MSEEDLYKAYGNSITHWRFAYHALARGEKDQATDYAMTAERAEEHIRQMHAVRVACQEVDEEWRRRLSSVVLGLLWRPLSAARYVPTLET